MDQWTLMEQSLADRDVGEKLIDTKVGGVHSTDNLLQHASILGYGQWPADYAVNF